MTKKQTAAKAISWRIVASSDTFVLAFVLSLFFDDVALAGAIALAEIPTKLIIYYLHERVWIRIFSRAS